MSSLSFWKKILLHLSIVTGLGVVLILVFFHVYLPITTSHGETITVPDVRGVTLDELDQFLKERNLRYEVTPDSGFSIQYKPLAVLKQFPMPNAKVKENRKIYVTLNSQSPPLVRMPKLVGGSVKNAQLVLKTYDLALGQIRYVPDLALNYILQQRMDGRELSEGERIPKGSKIDLVVGDGLGQQNMESPDLIGLDEESARFAIVGSGLKIGTVSYEKASIAVITEIQPDSTMQSRSIKVKVSAGEVFSQYPPKGQPMRIGQVVDLWIYKPDSLNVNPTLLD